MLRIHGVAVALVGEVIDVIEQVQRFDPDLAKQARRAMTSVPLNVAEGSDQNGLRRNHHYRIAMGSAREAWSALLVAHSCKYIDRPSPALENKFNQVIGTLHKIVNKPAKPEQPDQAE